MGCKRLLPGQGSKSFSFKPVGFSSRRIRQRRAKRAAQQRYQPHARKSRVSFSYIPESMSICKMQLDPAVAGCSIPPDPREQHETPEPARAAPAPSGPQKSRPETLKNSLFFFSVGLLSARSPSLSPFGVRAQARAQI